jgi:glycosyltransferase involved in cell wall biosynthesis
VPINIYPKLFKEIDIGIVPLTNIPFNHAKSFIKGLEYAAAGVPFVASYSPEYQYLADNGIGRIANNQEEWIYHLDQLRDIQTRRDEIEHNYEMLKNFSMEARADDWEAVMTEIREKS